MELLGKLDAGESYIVRWRDDMEFLVAYWVRP